LIKAGSVVAVRNGRAEVFKEKMRIEVDKWGKVTAEAGHDIKEITGKNISEILYETKIVKAVDKEDFGGERRGGRGGRGGSYRGGSGYRGGDRRGGDRRE